MTLYREFGPNLQFLKWQLPTVGVVQLVCVGCVTMGASFGYTPVSAKRKLMQIFFSPIELWFHAFYVLQVHQT